ncbi:MAG: hypothetical protein IJU58_03080 [Clostridia bacterium]|nr:hypothetical protein [Clostridia bacterium]
MFKAQVKRIVGDAQMREQAIKELQALGVLLPMENLHLFHGRMTADDECFLVKSDVNNAGYFDGHYNNNGIPGIHASNPNIAKKYADARLKEYYEKNNSSQTTQTATIYKLVPTQKGLFVFDLCKIYKMDEIELFLTNVFKLTPKETEEIYAKRLTASQEQQLKNIVSTFISTYTIPQLVPELFKDEKISTKIYKDLNQICECNKKDKQKSFVSDGDIETYCKKKLKDNESATNLAQDIGGCINVYQILKETGDIGLLFSKLQSDFNFTEDSTLNLTLFKNFVLQNNIIGVHQKLWVSNVIAEQNFDDYFIFDTSKINTEQFVKKQKLQKEKKDKNKEPATSVQTSEQTLQLK